VLMGCGGSAGVNGATGMRWKEEGTTTAKRESNPDVRMGGGEGDTKRKSILGI